MTNCIENEFLPLGYLIVKNGRGTSLTAGISYSGVNRRPPLPSDVPAIRREMGQPEELGNTLQNALEEYHNNGANDRWFFLSRAKAEALTQELADVGIPLELLFCELACLVGEESRIADYDEFTEPPPLERSLYGLDICWPNCSHSAIFCPGVVDASNAWMDRLNEWGLLTSLEDALELRSAYLDVYPYPPFDILRVFAI